MWEYLDNHPIITIILSIVIGSVVSYALLLLMDFIAYGIF